MYTSENIISKIKSLNLPSGQYIVLGGASLAVHGIRNTRDLDIIVTPELFENLISQKGWILDLVYQSKWNRRRLKRIDQGVELYPDLLLEKDNRLETVENLIEHAELIEDILFQKLPHLKLCKLDTAREKDLKDVDLIDNYLNVWNQKSDIK